jgi:hypothetical protein
MTLPLCGLVRIYCRFECSTALREKNQYYQQTERNSPKDLDFQGTEKLNIKKGTENG